MDSKDFFGAPDPGEELSKPSVLSVITDACVTDFAPWYRALPDGTFSSGDDVLCETQVFTDVCAWVRGIEGEDQLGAKISALVRANPGWEAVIARRVVKELRRWSITQ